MEIKNNTDIEKTNMENYKVILVDDEEEVIDAIKSRTIRFVDCRQCNKWCKSIRISRKVTT